MSLDDLAEQALGDLRQDANENDIFLKCPVCGAERGQPCRTPSGRKKQNTHDTRPFTINS
jgi:hypothetical protein